MIKTDDLGPEAVHLVHDPRTNMRGVLVVDNSVLGPCGGGTRMLPGLTVEEVADLARGMTYKFATFGLPRGGSKAGIFADPHMAPERKQAVLRSFGRAIAPLLRNGDVAVGPDMGVTVDDVAEIYAGAEVKNARSGLFAKIVDGDPAAYHFTGFGVVTAIEACLQSQNSTLNGARVAIEGFGQVGCGTARYAAQHGASVVAITTLRGGIYNSAGLDVARLLELRRQFGDECVLRYESAQALSPGDIYSTDVDVLVPGARPYVIHSYNANQVRAKVVCPGANIALTEDAEQALHEQGTTYLPDFVANSGAALASWVDFLGGSARQAFEVLNRMIGEKATELLTKARETGQTPSVVARTAVRKMLTSRARSSVTFDETRDIIRDIIQLGSERCAS